LTTTFLREKGRGEDLQGSVVTR